MNEKVSAQALASFIQKENELFIHGLKREMTPEQLTSFNILLEGAKEGEVSFIGTRNNNNISFVKKGKNILIIGFAVHGVSARGEFAFAVRAIQVLGYELLTADELAFQKPDGECIQMPATDFMPLLGLNTH